MQKFSEYLLDGSGNPITTADIAVYYFGTTTLAPLFATATGVAIANPITSQLSTGLFEFYAADGKYTLAISEPGYQPRSLTVEIINDQNPVYSTLSGAYQAVRSIEFNPAQTALRITHGVDATVAEVPLMDNQGPIHSTATGVYQNVKSLEFNPAQTALRVTYGDTPTVAEVPISDDNPVNQVIAIACSNETTPLDVGAAKVTFRTPFAFKLTGIRASVTTAPTGAALIADVKSNGTTLMAANKLRIDASTKSTVAAAAQPTLTTTALSSDAEITIDITQVGGTVAGAGLKVYLIGYPA